VAAACRQIGLDFMALTDHRAYQPSLDARDAFTGLALDLRIYPGEEVHPPGNPVHIVNFGGSFSVNALFAERAAYDQEIDWLARQTNRPLTAEEKRQFASCAWTFEQIRRGGGVGILCHPYWIVEDAHNISEALQDALYAERPFDALELIGGFYRHQMESNALAVARWQQARAEGRDMPVVGVSDAHGCERGELFGWYYSIVFAATTEFADLRQAIRAGQCVAVEAVEGEFPRLFGSFRLVKFSYFLLREIFPLHDELCVEEGRLMRHFAGGDTSVAGALAALQGRVGALYGRLWGG
jgi:predicted metal-dependent phosphoesterase TrpH